MRTIIFQPIINFLRQPCLDVFMPHTCALCHSKSKRDMDLCQGCENGMPFIQHACRYCAASLNGGMEVCGECLKNPPPFDCTVALCHYEPPITKLITDLKFHSQLVNARILGELMRNYISSHHKKKNAFPECIIPVPLSPKRLKERGFNQAFEIARPIAKHFKIPIDFKSCKRIRHTEAQMNLPAKLRHKNVKNAFAVESNFAAKHVAIIDDVVTTGHTVSELTRTLRKAGAERIEVWCCAKTKVSRK